MDFDVIVIGAGAAGMMCAATAGQRGRRVLLIDHASRLAEKIRISGGGRCNFTNLHCKPEAFLSRNPNFCRSVLSAYSSRDFVDLVRRHGIAYHEKTLGQLFCDGSAREIIAMLTRECDAAAVRWAFPVRVEHVLRSNETGFEVATSQGSYRCASLVIATGGLAMPKIGASPLGYRIAEQFGLEIVPPKAALVPLAADSAWLAQYGALAGVSFDANASCGVAPRSPSFREAVLLTHRGLSGPAVLQVSSYWQQSGGRGSIEIDLLPDTDAAAWLARHRHAKTTLADALAGAECEHIPRRFALRWAEAHGWTQPLSQLSHQAVENMACALKRWSIRPAGTLGYDKAEVTLGGVATEALSQRTMEAQALPGLFFVGEVVDVTGWLGGYNFQWAWSSGVAAGLAA